LDEKASTIFYFASNNSIVSFNYETKEETTLNVGKQKQEVKTIEMEEPTMIIVYDSSDNRIMIVNNGCGDIFILQNGKEISTFPFDCSSIVDCKIVENEIFLLFSSSKDAGTSLVTENEEKTKVTFTLKFHLHLVKLDSNFKISSKEEFLSNSPLLNSFINENGDLILISNQEIEYSSIQNDKDDEMIEEDIVFKINKNESQNTEEFRKIMNERLAPFTTDKFDSDEEDNLSDYTDSIFIFFSKLKKLKKLDSNKKILSVNNNRIGIALDVDLCSFVFKKDKFQHESTIHAMNYILESRPNRKWVYTFESKAFIIQEEQISIYDTQEMVKFKCNHQILQFQSESILGFQFLSNQKFIILTTQRIYFFIF
jgi:hypothetical protein